MEQFGVLQPVYTAFEQPARQPVDIDVVPPSIVVVDSTLTVTVPSTDVVIVVSVEKVFVAVTDSVVVATILVIAVMEVVEAVDMVLLLVTHG